jgi:hypothetical protein
MTELDAELIPLTLEVIEEYGKGLDYTLTGQSSYDPNTQTNTPATVPLPGIKMAPPEDYSGFSIANGLAEAGDKKILIPASYFLDIDKEPTPEDLASFDEAVWTVKAVKTYFSGELPCLYELRVSK